jgi:hypothetical protein
MVRRHCQNGNLAAFKVGSRWVIRETDLEAFAAIPRKRGPKINEAVDTAMKTIAHSFSVDPKFK